MFPKKHSHTPKVYIHALHNKVSKERKDRKEVTQVKMFSITTKTLVTKLYKINSNQMTEKKNKRADIKAS